MLRGFDYDAGRRQHEPGDIVDDLPAEFVGWMLAEGVIKETAASGAVAGSSPGLHSDRPTEVP